MAKDKLNFKQELFCHEYLLDHNATQAYIRAGYSPNGASAAAITLLKNIKVAARVEKISSERIKAIDVGIEQIYAALWDNHMISKARGETQNSSRALELCGKAQAMFIDKVESKVTEYSELSEADLDLVIAQKKKELEELHTH